MLSDSTFTGYDYTAYNGATVVDSATSLTSKTVRYHPDRITVDKIRFTMVGGSTATSFCMDTLIATDEHWLNGQAVNRNKYIDFTSSSDLNYNSASVTSTKPTWASW